MKLKQFTRKHVFSPSVSQSDCQSDNSFDRSVSYSGNSLAGHILFNNLGALPLEIRILTLALVQKFQKCGPWTISPFHSVCSRTGIINSRNLNIPINFNCFMPFCMLK